MLLSVASALLPALLALNSAWWPAAHADFPRLRATDARLARLVKESLNRSGTFADMARALENSDVILHVVPSEELRCGVLARLLFVGDTGKVRYLRAEILMRRANPDLIGTIAHELQHALEVAARPDVRDEQGLRRLYEEIGQSRRLDTFDTRVAQQLGWQVRSEVLAD